MDAAAVTKLGFHGNYGTNLGTVRLMERAQKASTRVLELSTS
jgi:hypothetical protein